MKRSLLTTTTVLGLALAGGPANAFDENVWDWNKTVSEDVNIVIDVISELTPTGHVEMQHSQVLNGDVLANVSFDGNYLSNDALSFNGNGFGTIDAQTQMPTVAGDAVAIGNFLEIQTETATYLNIAQTHNALNELDGGNGVLAVARAGSAENPVAAAVDLSATAISNYLSIQGSPGPSDNTLIAEVTQVSNANVDAFASATQDMSGYHNLGNLQNDINGVVGNLRATAIGNYVSVKFGPDVDFTISE